jgi:hypothetical protein
MTKVTCDIAMSIDGYVAGPNQSRTYAGGVNAASGTSAS